MFTLFFELISVFGILLVVTPMLFTQLLQRVR